MAGWTAEGKDRTKWNGHLEQTETTPERETDLTSKKYVNDGDAGADTHAAGDGSDHADVATNTTHISSDGSDHTFINQNVTTTGTPTFTSVNGMGINTAGGSNIVLSTSTDTWQLASASPIGWSISSPVVGGKTLSVTASSALNQDVATTSSPEFVSVDAESFLLDGTANKGLLKTGIGNVQVGYDAGTFFDMRDTSMFFKRDGVWMVQWSSGGYSPYTTNSISLGTSAKRWSDFFAVDGDFSGNVTMSNLPTSDPSVAGRLWNDAGTVKVSAG